MRIKKNGMLSANKKKHKGENEHYTSKKKYVY